MKYILFLVLSVLLTFQSFGAQTLIETSTNLPGGRTIINGNFTELYGRTAAPSNVRYVSTTGNNGTAVVGNIGLPYLTVKAAVDASVSGDVIMILPGSYTEIGPWILKNNTSVVGMGGHEVTTVTFDGSFYFQKSGGSGQTWHGGVIQPSPGTSRVDSATVEGLTVIMTMPLAHNGAYTAITGVNTATGTAITGTGTEFADLIVRDCDLTGTSDVHITIDAVSRAYFHNCTVRSGFDFTHLLGPNNIAFAEFDNCRFVYRPFANPELLYPAIDTYARVRSGGLTLRGCSLLIHNDSYPTGYSADDAHKGFKVDDKAGAFIEVIGGLPTSFKGGAFEHAIIPRFSSHSTTTGVATKGSVIIDGHISGLCDYNDITFDAQIPVKIVPRSDTTISSEVFASAASSITKANTYRAKEASATQTVYMIGIAPGTVVKGVRLDRQTAFSGGAGTVTTIEVGIVGNTTKYLGATDIRTTGNASSGALFDVEGSGDPLTGNATLVVITLRNTGANVGTLTDGSVKVLLDLGAVPLPSFRG